MPRKLISFTLTFLIILGMVIPSYASAPYVDCSVSEGSKVNVTWSLNQSRTVKIYRDGAIFKVFNNTQSGNYGIDETEAGTHTYRAEAINPGGQDYKSDTIVTVGTGKPKITLQFINKHGTATSVERIYNWVKINNLGSVPLDLSRMKIRYFYTVDGEPSAVNVKPVDPNRGQQKVEISDARINPNYSFNENNQVKDVLVMDSVAMNFTKVVPPVVNNKNVLVCDYYCDTYFQNVPSNGKILSGYNIKLQPAFNKKNLTNDERNSGKDYIRNYNPQDDYSFDPTATDWKENKKICVYYDDELIWGDEPFGQMIAPSDLTAKTEINNIKLDWKPSPGADKYKIFRSATQNDEYIEIGTIDAFNASTGKDITSYTDVFADKDSPSLDKYTGKEYFYKVKAVWGTSESDYSNIASSTIYYFRNTSLGVLTCRIISKKDNTNFVLGSYIPIVFELKLNNKTAKPTIKLINEQSSKLISELVINNNANGVKLLRATKNANALSVVSDSNKQSLTKDGNNLIFNGEYAKDDIIRVEFIAKFKATSVAINAGLTSCFGISYDLNFTVEGTRSNVLIGAKDPINLPVKIVKSNKLK